MLGPRNKLSYFLIKNLINMIKKQVSPECCLFAFVVWLITKKQVFMFLGFLVYRCLYHISVIGANQTK